MALEVTVVKDMAVCVVEKGLARWTCEERSRSCGEDRMAVDRRRLVMSIDQVGRLSDYNWGSRLYVRCI
jgi:hypothetical protein